MSLYCDVLTSGALLTLERTTNPEPHTHPHPLYHIYTPGQFSSALITPGPGTRTATYTLGPTKIVKTSQYKACLPYPACPSS